MAVLWMQAHDIPAHIKPKQLYSWKWRSPH